MGGTLFTVAKDVKFQVEFNPAVVSSYRLIGYENRVMADTDFNDDTKDAGEIGAGHRVTVLYELVTADSADQVDVPELTYQTSQTTGSTDYLTVKVRYKAPAGSTSQLLTYPVSADAYTDAPSENFLFASAVAQYGMLLRGSQHAGTASYRGVLAQLEACQGLSEDDYKTEFFSIVEDTYHLDALQN